MIKFRSSIFFNARTLSAALLSSSCWFNWAEFGPLSARAALASRLALSTIDFCRTNYCAIDTVITPRQEEPRIAKKEQA
jgi:hypothetical protein